MKTNSYLYLGTGNACAGHTKVICSEIFTRTLLDSSPDVSFGTTLPTGSDFTEKYEKKCIFNCT